MSDKRGTLRNVVPEKKPKQVEKSEKKRKERRSTSPSRKASTSSRKAKSIIRKPSTPETPQTRVSVDSNPRTPYNENCDKCEGCSGLSKESPQEIPQETPEEHCCTKDESRGVSIKDVGLDIAGFLIEEEIKKNKEKLRMEIIRQISLSRELDKHLERQRLIMNHYICHNTLQGPPVQCPNINIDKCNCLVCQEVASENVPIPPRKSIRKRCFSEKSLQVNTPPKFKNSFSQSSPMTKDVSCQDDCEECLCVEENNDEELCVDCYIEDYTNTLPTKPLCCNDACVNTNVLTEDATTEMTNVTLNNISTLLKTPLETIEPQPQKSPEDTTEVILCNIKSIIQDYMENMNITCKNCNLEPKTSKHTSESNSKEDINKSSNKSEDTKFENGGTHIDIIMKFSEANKRKKAILEIEPCFEKEKCIKYNKKKCSKKKTISGDTNDHIKCCVSSDSQISVCKSDTSITSNCCSKFSPYPLKDRNKKSSKPKQTICSSDNYCKEKKCQGTIDLRKKGSKTSSASSVGQKSKNKKDSKQKKKSTVKRRKKGLFGKKSKSTVVTSYATNIGGFLNEKSKHHFKKSRREQEAIPSSFTNLLKPIIKHDHKNDQNFDEQKHHLKTKQTLNPCNYTTRQRRERGGTTTSSLDSSNLDETSYPEIQMYEKPRKHLRKGLKNKRISNICSATSFILESSNFSRFQPIEKCLTAKESDILKYIIPTSEQRSINRLKYKNKILTSSKKQKDSNLLNKTSKLRTRKSIKEIKNATFDTYTSSSSHQSVSEIILKHRKRFKTGIKLSPKVAESDSSVDEIVSTESLKNYSKLNSEGGVLLVSPYFETKRIELIKNWLSYMHKLQGKEYFKTISPAIVAIKLPTSSNYVVPNEDSEQQIEFLLTPKPEFSKQLSDKNIAKKLKESAFEKFNANNYAVNNKQPEIGISQKGATYKKDRKEIEFNDPAIAAVKQFNKKGTGSEFNRSKFEMLHTESSITSNYSIMGSSLSDTTFESTSESLLDVNENNHDELIRELICPNRNIFQSRKYFDVSETDKIINRAFYIQDIFVKLASTEEEKEYWRDTVLRAMKSIVTKTS